MDPSRIIQNVRTSGNWNQSLRDANDLFHFGPTKFEDAAKRYCKIIELLLRYLHKEVVPTLKSKKRADVLQAEVMAGQDKPFEEFTFGQEIEVFSRSGLLEHVNKICGTSFLDEKRLRELNNLRKEVTHHDDATGANEVNTAREYVTNILLSLKLISEDPEKPMKIPREAKEPDAKQKRMDNLRAKLRTIRIGLIDKVHFNEVFDMEKDYAWHAQAQVIADVVGVYLGSDETFNVVVNILDLESPEDDPTEVIEYIAKKVEELIIHIAPETKSDLRIVFFEEQATFGSPLENSGCATWSAGDGLIY